MRLRERRPPKLLDDEITLGDGTLRFLPERDPAARARISSPFGPDTCALGGAVAVTLQEILTAELPLWTEEDRIAWQHATGLSATGPIITAAAGRALATLICTDCRTVDWTTPQGDELRQHFGLARELARFVAYDPLTITLQHYLTSGCPPLPPQPPPLLFPSTGQVPPPQQCQVIPGWLNTIICDGRFAGTA